MIEKMNKWLSAHKQLCVITGIFGLYLNEKLNSGFGPNARVNSI